MTTLAPLRVHVGRRVLPLTLSTEEAGELLGYSDDTIRRRCEAGELPTLDRHGEKQSWRIPTGKLLEALGIPFRVGAAK